MKEMAQHGRFIYLICTGRHHACGLGSRKSCRTPPTAIIKNAVGNPKASDKESSVTILPVGA